MPDPPANPESTLVRRAGKVGLAVAISRVLGLVREQVIAAVFGAGRGPVTDAFTIAFRIPNLLRDLFAEGALSAAFVPTFTSALRDGREPAWRLFNVVLNALAVLLGGIVLLLIVFAPEVVWALAAGYTGDKQDLAAGLTRITAPFLVFVSFAALAMGALNATGRFFVPALAPALFNCAMIACALALPGVLPRWGFEPVVALAVGALLGGALQLAAQLPALWREGYRCRPAWDLAHPGLRRIAGMMGPAVIGMSVVQLSVVIDAQFASHLPGHGPVSWLNFAFRIMYLPIGVVGVAIGTAHLVEAARHAAEGRPEEIRGAVRRALRLTAFLALPATAGLIALRVPIVRVLYEHGAFTAEDTRQTAAALSWYAAGILTYAAIKVFVPTFYATGNTRVPLVAGLCAVGAKVAASALLVGPLGHAGLALSTAAATAVNVAVLAVVLWRRSGAFVTAADAWALARMGAAAAAMGAGAAWVHGAACRVWGDAALGGQVASVGLAVVSGVALYGGLCAVLGVGDGAALARAAFGRRGGGAGEGGVTPVT